MSDLVKRLSNGKRAVVASHSENAQELGKSIEKGFVFVKFTGTKGGTELGIPLDKEKSSTEGADFEHATGAVHLVGNLTLDYEEVELIADIELATMKGKGQLNVVTSRDTP